MEWTWDGNAEMKLAQGNASLENLTNGTCTEFTTVKVERLVCLKQFDICNLDQLEGPMQR